MCACVWRGGPNVKDAMVKRAGVLSVFALFYNYEVCVSSKNQFFCFFLDLPGCERGEVNAPRYPGMHKLVLHR